MVKVLQLEGKLTHSAPVSEIYFVVVSCYFNVDNFNCSPHWPLRYVTSVLFCNHADKDSLDEEVKTELAIQIMGVTKLMASDPDYITEDAYEVLCKV